MTPAFPFGRVRPIMLRVVIGSLIVAAAVAIFSIATGSFDDTSWQLIGTATLFAFFALFSWYDADVSSRRSTRFALVSFAVSIYLFIAGMVKIWVPERPDDFFPFAGFGGWLVLAVIARLALLHVHLVLFTEARLHSRVISAVTRVTLVLVAALAVLLSLPVLIPEEFGEAYWRAVAVIAILDALGTVLIPLGYQLFAAPHAHARHPSTPDAPTTGPEVPIFRPPVDAYAKPGQPLLLQWPKYTDGRDLPQDLAGNPDFTGVLGYEDWLASTTHRAGPTSEPRSSGGASA